MTATQSPAYGGSASTTSQPSTSHTTSGKVTTGSTSLGTVLVDSQGRTTQRSDGKAEVTYNGHPLYTYIGDSKPGAVNGQGLTAFGAAWFVVSQSGSASGGR